MNLFSYNNVRISGLTSSVPSNIQKVDYENNSSSNYASRFIQQTGITQRHISITGQTCTDTGLDAAARVLKKLEVDPKSLSGIVFVSQTPDFGAGTGNAKIIHEKLGLNDHAFSFDITEGCAAFPYGLSVCSALLQHEGVCRILMLCGDTISTLLYNSKDELLQSKTFLEGEGTCAILLEKKEKTYPLRISLFSRGSGIKYLHNQFDGYKNRWSRPENISSGRYMDGLEITKFATDTVVKSIREFCSYLKQEPNDFDGLVLHQANLQILRTICKRLNFDEDRLAISLDEYANTSAASVPLTINHCYAGSSEKQLHLLASAFGIGLSWGVIDMYIHPEVIFPIEMLS